MVRCFSVARVFGSGDSDGVAASSAADSAAVAASADGAALLSGGDYGSSHVVGVLALRCRPQRRRLCRGKIYKDKIRPSWGGDLRRAIATKQTQSSSALELSAGSTQENSVRVKVIVTFDFLLFSKLGRVTTLELGRGATAKMAILRGVKG
ncbi:hypothetical protein Acr_15g0010430 [Actinidia rufa]|uniref:Uncharacterized protein n=1 Tax=Actinidia rufa TaxID=165716 RepID=A0A7J0FUQ4_9ERIC|nr:hypothetical protein Acr_15g0010430 [Actinidia rufa]